MQALLRRITRGIGTGAALAIGTVGCARAIQAPDASGESDATPPGVDSGQSLQPFPLDLTCTLQDGGYCCYLPQCYVVAGACPDVDAPTTPAEPTPAHLSHCGRHGPFAPNPAYADTLWPDPDGNCCYVLPYEIAEPGRPLLANGVARLATVVTRLDWLLT